MNEPTPKICETGMGSAKRRYDLWPGLIRDILRTSGNKGALQSEVCDLLGLTRLDFEGMEEAGEALKLLKELGLAQKRVGRWYDYRVRTPRKA